MPKFVVYEVWTKARVVEAPSYKEVYQLHEPDASLAREHGLSLCNWHAVACDGSVEADEPTTDTDAA